MKAITRKYNLTLILFLITALNSFSQSHYMLDSFDVLETGKKVYVNCVVSSGSTCNGIDLLRSDDSVNFVSVAHIGGICGRSSSPTPYKIIDEHPIKNKPAYYKLELGGYGFTEVLSVHIIDTKELGFQIRPNPAKEETTIYFENKYNILHTLSLLNNNGQVILSQSTLTNAFGLDVRNIPSGIYSFIISKDAYYKNTVGKLVVQH